MRAAFPKAKLFNDEQRLYAWFQQVRDFVLLPQEALDLPVDIQGTAFQSRVWRALRRIPLGSTASYTQVARRLGEPRATRAVASACARNQVALLIPCHRVVAADGRLSGYRWGVDRKRELLSREGADVIASRDPLPRLPSQPSPNELSRDRASPRYGRRH